MRTVIGLFDDRNEAMRAYTALYEAGFAKADLDILTNDDSDDVPKLASMKKFVPEPDVTIYLEGVRKGGTIITGHVADGSAARAAEIMSGFAMVNIGKRAVELKAVEPSLPTLTDASKDPNVFEVIEEELQVGKEQVERGRMRIYNVVTEQQVTQNVGLRDETIKVQRRPVNKTVAVNPNLFTARSFEMVEMDEIAKVTKTARVVEEVSLGKEVVENIQTIKETLKRQDVQVEQIASVRPYAEYDAAFRTFYTTNLATSGVTYEALQPALKFGYEMGTTEPFRSAPWTAVEVDAKKIWEGKNPGTWDQNAAVVKYAWEKVRNTR
jgi:uncharacterized protein (TIGR02271 family)